MKLFKLSMATAILAAATLTASAQIGFDSYKAMRIYSFGSPVWFQPGTAAYTNGPIDKVGLTGTGTILFAPSTNAAAQTTITATVYQSNDQTNWTAVPNYSLATATSLIVTNFSYGVGTNSSGWLTATDTILLPGTVTTPGAASAGYATPYITYNPFTNSAAVTLTSGKPAAIGVNLNDAYRYLEIVYAAGGSGGTNGNCTAVLVAPNYSTLY
ncbi:MAG: hypothetical protein KGJ13_06465 [Patescibacteria group bacterium]|nr:hypothetical protein [Patescibacteria group bacterium]